MPSPSSQLARGLPTDGAGNGSYQQFIPNLPGAASTIKVVATDGAGNAGEGVNAVAFALNAAATLVAPTTLRDFDMPGTQPFQGS